MKKFLFFTVCLLMSTVVFGQKSIDKLWKKTEKNVECSFLLLNPTDDNSEYLIIEKNSHCLIDLTSKKYRSLGRELTHQGISYDPQNDTLLFIFHYQLLSLNSVSFYSKSEHKRYYYNEEGQKLTEISHDDFDEDDIYTEKIEKSIFNGNMQKVYKLICEKGIIMDAIGNSALRIIIKSGKIVYPSILLMYET